MENESTSDAGVTQKKRRRGGWDQPADIVPNPVVAATTNVIGNKSSGEFILPGLQAVVSTPTITGPIVPSAEFLQLQSALAIQQKAKALEGCRIYVGALQYELSQENIRALFSPFGTITKVDLSREPGTTRSKGFCFIEYDNPASAEAAMALNGFELAGRNIKVGRPAGAPPANSSVDSSVPNLTISSISFGLTAKEQAQILLSQALVKPAPLPIMSNPVAVVPPPPPPPPPRPPTNPPLTSGSHSQSEATSGFRTVLVRNIAPEINRDMLKVVFSSFGTVTACSLIPSADSLSTPGLQSATLHFQLSSSAKEAATSMKDFSLAGHTLGVDLIPTPAGSAGEGDNGPQDVLVEQLPPVALVSVVLENMVAESEASDPDLKDEIAEECSRHGPLEKEGVEIKVENGIVMITVTYVSEDHAKAAFMALNGRFFAGRKVKASLKPKQL